jgi:hypothetical protein
MNPQPQPSGIVNEPMPEWTSISGGWTSSPGPLRRAALPLAVTVAAGLAARRGLSS